MVVKLNLMVAVCENMGIGINGQLPWKLKTEMAYFSRMTTTTTDPAKQNVALMGRLTWDSLYYKYKPLPNRINIVLSRNKEFKVDYPNVFVYNSLDSVIEFLKTSEMMEKYENVWVIGGSHIFKEAMQSKHFYRLYLTQIMEKFDCDTFMPPLPDNITLVKDPRVPEGINEEKGIKFEYKVYENKNFNL